MQQIQYIKENMCKIKIIDFVQKGDVILTKNNFQEKMLAFKRINICSVRLNFRI